MAPVERSGDVVNDGTIFLLLDIYLFRFGQSPKAAKDTGRVSRAPAAYCTCPVVGMRHVLSSPIAWPPHGRSHFLFQRRWPRAQVFTFCSRETSCGGAEGGGLRGQPAPPPAGGPARGCGSPDPLLADGAPRPGGRVGGGREREGRADRLSPAMPRARPRPALAFIPGPIRKQLVESQAAPAVPGEVWGRGGHQVRSGVGGPRAGGLGDIPRRPRRSGRPRVVPAGVSRGPKGRSRTRMRVHAPAGRGLSSWKDRAGIPALQREPTVPGAPHPADAGRGRRPSGGPSPGRPARDSGACCAPGARSERPSGRGRPD